MKIFEQPILDKLSIATSVICAIHCAIVPIFIALFPTISVFSSNEHEFHQAIVWFIIPLSIMAGFLGCYKHKSKRILLTILSGLCLLVFAALFVHELWGENVEKTLTVFATMILAFAHWQNFKRCRDNSCDH
ncbi:MULTISPECIES: MerC domain-containing protein [Thalassotalea]|uniref:MerC domain-containing protein n=1 Tax=Thalassotalea TaxID=1518149 RepID=UPI0009440FEA|nr:MULTISPECIES: MerC domain-containing protein [Thalassotalea]OKY25018.1 hypothetical protein BI291_17635 [Thalassotalea sp. PP2-459]